ncbi:DUF1566 domain-containing protein [Ruficoccus sp. ZRK36]|uniref:Lcl domain-containing protein n=1 Tax=Ruficoccus sp. ZRK36 TaxID=2866311 RepID=UPI001C735364|nr:DUF1566 domain-containing protein [Ruficoccus sp. ZRK36]QYY36453.1 DUF1566 domain-containing protein [Ruficoccus sp. ZRK36]
MKSCTLLTRFSLQAVGCLFPLIVSAQVGTFTVVDTGQVTCYDNTRAIAYPQPGQPFYGQDAEFAAHPPAYRDNGDGTVSDLNTGLMWSQGLDKTKLSLAEAKKTAATLKLAGYDDWRVPTIKELYSLMDFRGRTGTGGQSRGSAPADAIPYIDTDYFAFAYGDEAAGERYIDAQWLSSTEYVSTTMHGAKTLFGVNFADGRIKGYGYTLPGRDREKKFYVRYVRGGPYGENSFVHNEDGTVTDTATGLVWMQADSGKGMNWEDALAYAENLQLGGFDDWRLPTAKELQSIVDYTRSPDTTDSPAIDPVFACTAIKNEGGAKDWAFYWTSTTHCDGPNVQAAYIAFGRALGRMHGQLMDVHGAGAQRSDPKTGEANPEGHGPQGDIVRVNNFVRCVRGGAAVFRAKAPASDPDAYPTQVVVDGHRYKPAESSSVRPRTGGMMRGQGQSNSDQGPGGMRGPGGNRPSFIEHLDRDGDGKVSRSEFDGPPNHFDVLDKNGDGTLTEDEAPSGPPPGRGVPPQR